MAGEFQVRQELRFVNREESFDGLQLHNQAAIHDEVEPQARIQADIVVGHRQHDLSFHLQASFGQLVYETNLVDALQEARPQSMVDCIGRVHHLTSDLI